MDRVEFVHRNKRLLEGLFPPGWFSTTRRKKHPAYLRWDFCRTLIERRGMIRLPEQAAEFPLLGRILLDSYIFVALTGGDADALTLGSIDLLGDGAVQRKIRSRLPEPSQYEDLMVELSSAASLRTRGYEVDLIESDGCPDLRLLLPNNARRALVECKSLNSPSSERLHRVIKKANQQLSRGQDEVDSNAYGVLALDVSTVVNAGRVENDTLPQALEALLAQIKKELDSGRRAAIGTVLVLWDDYMVIGTPPASTMIAFRRRVERLSGAGTGRRVPGEVALIEGWTVTYMLNWGPSAESIRQARFSELFEKEFQHQFHISRRHVIDTLDKFDKEDVLPLDAQRQFVLRSRLVRASREFYMLVGAERTGELATVQWAFKIDSSIVENINAISPLQILERFANAYGLPVRVGELSGHFILSHRSPVRPQGETQLVGVENPANHSFIVCALIRVDQEAEGRAWANCTLVFCIDTTRYHG